MTPPAQSDSEVGFEVTIAKRDRFDGVDAWTEWQVDARRLSDGAEARRAFGWRWRALRFARSTRRLNAACNRSKRAKIRQRIVLRHGAAGWEESDG